MNAKVLVAHSETKLRQYREAEQTFDEALVLAKDQRKFISNSFCFFNLIDWNKFLKKSIFRNKKFTKWDIAWICRVFPLVVSSLCMTKLFSFFPKLTLNHLDFILGDVAAEKAIERAAKDVRDQIAKGAADCKLNNSLFAIDYFLPFSSTWSNR